MKGWEIAKLSLEYTHHSFYKIFYCILLNKEIKSWKKSTQLLATRWVKWLCIVYLLFILDALAFMHSNFTIRIRKLTNEYYVFISKERVWGKLLLLFYTLLHSLKFFRSTAYVIVVFKKVNPHDFYFLLYSRLSSVKARKYVIYSQLYPLQLV